MKSLNKVYENNELFYYCNTCGDINIPNTNPLSWHNIDELPLKERNLYENYWYDGAGCHMHVVNYKDNPAMALGFLFDKSYLSDILDKDDVTEKDMESFYAAVMDYAKMLEKDNEISDCEILVGENTDPDGHELLVIIPYEKRTEIEKIAKYLDKHVYDTVEKLI